MLTNTQALIQWMRRRAESYYQWALLKKSAQHMEDARVLLAWIDGLDLSDIAEALDKPSGHDIIITATAPVEKAAHLADLSEESRWEMVRRGLVEIPAALRRSLKATESEDGVQQDEYPLNAAEQKVIVKEEHRL